MSKTIPFEEDAVKEYLDKCIRYWRKQKQAYAVYYVDAYQSLRISLFGETLKEPKDEL